MIERYSRPEMASIWTEDSRFDRWLKIELAVCDEWSKAGQIPEKSLKIIKSKAKYDIQRINEIEAEVHHDVIAFLTSVSEFVGPDSRFIHMGMTSSDLLDTTFALQLKEASELILTDLKALVNALEKRAHEFKNTPMIGRSHGIHAEPITFGLKLALWFSEFSRHIVRLEAALTDIAVGKISGAVGTFAHITPDIEEAVCSSLGLKAASISTQVVQRDRHAHFFSVLAGIAASIEKVSVEIRHLQRTEVAEAAEPFGSGQKGSSAMPHKRNPILCENLTGLARVVRSNAMAAFEDVALWHERDISHSSVERIIAPDSTILVDFMLARLHRVIDGLDVFPERMKSNLDSSLGLYSSQDVMLSLVESGMTREDAYSAVQSTAMKAWNEKRSFLEVIKENDIITSKLNNEKLESLFDLKRHLKYVDTIFNRVFKE
ncbi:MAG: adenylosuccinate lyase [Deltaproteobacteria bacterium]|nr:adenylosuccinate lyase [Deltaproteobacteria bacterium]